MSKKAKRASRTKRAPRTTAARTVANRASRLLSAPPAAAEPSQRTAAATIFVSDVGGQFRVRTSPQRLTAGSGWVEWTVVNLTSRPMPDIDITWRDGRGPWGAQAIPVRNGNARKQLPVSAAAPTVFKYNVTCHGFTEDPELEFPVN